jgi:hypothetical protein
MMSRVLKMLSATSSGSELIKWIERQVLAHARVAAINRRVHAQRYNQIITGRILAEKQQQMQMQMET